MKNKALLFFAIAFCMAATTQAQIVNAGFENWKTDTTQFNGFLTIPPETFTYPDPVDWTSSNAISAMSVAGGHKFVEQSSDFAAGQYAISIRTDTIAPINMGPLGTKILTLPGFVLNGNFVIDPSNIVNGTVITPMSVKGAGQPFTQQLKKIKGQYKYAPAFNTIKNTNDTCLVWATLRKGNQVIADAVFKSGTSTGGNYQSFEADFKYVSCEMPDTLVILIGSSIPNVPGLFSGESDLVRGSVLLVDALDYELIDVDYQFTPIARPDLDTVAMNSSKNILVKLNDEDCDNSTPILEITVNTNPAHGTAVVGPANAYVTYTPANNYTGRDTFTYTLNDGVNTSDPARVVVLVRNPTGIAEANLVPVLVYPVPATDKLYLQFENKGRSTAKVYDMIGQLLGTYPLNSNTNSLPVANLQNGMYSVQVVNERDEVIAVTRFSVSK